MESPNKTPNGNVEATKLDKDKCLQEPNTAVHFKAWMEYSGYASGTGGASYARTRNIRWTSCGKRIGHLPKAAYCCVRSQSYLARMGTILLVLVQP